MSTILSPYVPPYRQCAAIKRQLCLLLPGAHIFLDVDDLEDINRLEECIRASAVIIIFVSKGYVSRGPPQTLRPGARSLCISR